MPPLAGGVGAVDCSLFDLGSERAVTCFPPSVALLEPDFDAAGGVGAAVVFAALVSAFGWACLAGVFGAGAFDGGVFVAGVLGAAAFVAGFGDGLFAAEVFAA